MRPPDWLRLNFIHIWHSFNTIRGPKILNNYLRSLRGLSMYFVKLVFVFISVEWEPLLPTSPLLKIQGIKMASENI